MEEKNRALHNQGHMPKNPLFFEKVIPVMLVILGVVMLMLVLFAAAILMGIIQF